ncbi:MAG: flagellin [Anaerolineae bacterium]|nr:flagellin [Anaerolineae bacterium]MDW8098418.1 flagellin [Anaerolineae bacterium]
MATIDFTRINTNVAALNALNTLREVNKNLALAQTRLSTGRRINEAADDPAGLTLATKFDVRATGMQVAIDNIGDAKNLLAVAEGGLRKINEILAKMRAKAEAAASDTLGDAERAAIADDLEQFALEIDDIVRTTTWNSQQLISSTVTWDFHTGAASSDFTTWSLNYGHNSADLGIDTITVGSAASARAYIDLLDTAIASVSASLSNIGSMMARLTFKEDTLAIGKVNTEAAYNRIMNADMAVEQLNAVKFQILQQTAIAMLAQANIAPQAVLQLIGGR